MAIVELTRRSVLALFAVSASVFPALAQTPAKPTDAKLTPIRLMLDGRIEGPDAPFFLAIDRGYYKAEGLDVTIETAATPVDPINRVAEGAVDMARADINTLIKLRDVKPATPVKAVFIVYDRPAYAIIARKSRGIAKPKDLEGKKLGAPLASPTVAQWPIFARTAGIDGSKVTIEPIGLAVRDPMLAAGQVDAVAGFSFSTYIDLKERGVPPDDLKVLLMADYGVHLYGSVIMVNTKFADENPDAVKGFLRAYVRALRDTVRDPARAVEAVLRRDDTGTKEVELERLRMAIRENILTPAVKANGYGAVDPARLEAAIDQLAWTHNFKAKGKAAEAFDPAFLPPPAVRKAH
jgi:NitT/TauT family transport system substrate-binding protein